MVQIEIYKHIQTLLSSWSKKFMKNVTFGYKEFKDTLYAQHIIKYFLKISYFLFDSKHLKYDAAE